MKKILFSLILILSISFTSCIKVIDLSYCGSTYTYNYYYYDFLGYAHRELYTYNVYQDYNGCYIRYYYYGSLIKFYI